MTVTIVDAPSSPNRNSRRGATINCIVVHDTESATAKQALAWFESPASEVSAHYVIDRDGTVYRCVPDEDRAWHAGRSVLAGREDVNTISIGIELAGFAATGYTPQQVDGLVDLCVELGLRHRAITVDRIVGHQDIAVPPGRKSDPGPHFPWDVVRARVQAGLDGSLA
jgi:N-acetylmuramoyl-L-alanine amidase